MNQTLQKAVDIARSFPEDEQEDLGRELMRLLEEKAIDAKLAASEKRGGFIPAEEAFERARNDIKKEYGL